MILGGLRASGTILPAKNVGMTRGRGLEYRGTDVEAKAG